MTSGWYVAKTGGEAGSETGPFEWEQLYQLARNGTVQPDDLVWNPRLPRGVAARIVPGLFPGLETPQPSQPREEPTPTPVATPLDIEQSEPAIEDVPLAEEPAEEAEPQRDIRRERAAADTKSNRLPLMVVLLVFVIAAAGVAFYFLYFRV